MTTARLLHGTALEWLGLRPPDVSGDAAHASKSAGQRNLRGRPRAGHRHFHSARLRRCSASRISMLRRPRSRPCSGGNFVGDTARVGAATASMSPSERRIATALTRNASATSRSNACSVHELVKTPRTSALLPVTVHPAPRRSTTETTGPCPEARRPPGDGRGPFRCRAEMERVHAGPQTRRAHRTQRCDQDARVTTTNPDHRPIFTPGRGRVDRRASVSSTCWSTCRRSIARTMKAACTVHRLFWGLPAGRARYHRRDARAATVTEMVFVPDDVRRRSVPARSAARAASSPMRHRAGRLLYATATRTA